MYLSLFQKGLIMKLKQDSIGIGQNLKRLRKLSGYSQSEFTQKLQLMGVSISCDIYKKMEQNRYNIRISELLAMQHILGVPINEFFDGLSYHDDEKKNSK